MVGAVAALSGADGAPIWLKSSSPAVPARAELRMRLGSKYRQV
jgi:hypothetical protein